MDIVKVVRDINSGPIMNALVAVSLATIDSAPNREAVKARLLQIIADPRMCEHDRACLVKVCAAITQETTEQEVGHG